MAYYLSTLNPLTWNNHISAKRNIWALYVHKIVQITSTGLLENIPISAFKAFLQTEHSFLKSVFDVSNLDFISVFPELLPFFLVLNIEWYCLWPFFHRGWWSQQWNHQHSWCNSWWSYSSHPRQLGTVRPHQLCSTASWCRWKLTLIWGFEFSCS